MKLHSRLATLLLISLFSFAVIVLPANAGMVSYWTFDSNMNDSVGSNNGTAVNGATIGTTSKVIGGGALSLNGANQYVNVGNSSSLNLTGLFTISMWMYNENLNGPQVNTGYYTRGVWNEGASLLAHGQQPVPSGAQLWSNYGVNNTELKNGQWYQIALTFNGSTAAYYVDGKQVTSFAASGAGSYPAISTFIGAEGAGRWFLQGSIDDVGVYNNALDAASMALVNGLGRTGGIGLDQLEAAQTLWAGSVGDTAVIGGATWRKVSGLPGSMGDWSGTVAGADARIVLDGAGNGIRVVAATGPLDYFAISAISSPQVKGTAITGITLTAKDASNYTVESFAGTVTFGGTAGITGTSGSFTGGQLTGVSVTPAVVGSGLTFTVDDGAGHTGTATFDVNLIATIPLLSYWTFDSNMNDSVGGNNGTAAGNAAIGATSMIGGGALSLDGNGDYVRAGTGSGSSLNITGSITITMWVQGSNLTGGNVGFFTRADWNVGQSLLSHAGPLWCNNSIEGGQFSNGTWYQIAKTYDGTTVRLYLNGKQVVSGTSANGGTSSTHETWIGAEGNSSGRYWLNGSIDDVGVYTNALDAASVALVNGLGRSGGVGLDQLTVARTLWASPVGTYAEINGARWKRVSGLTGNLGDWSGSVAGNNAQIVLDNAGGGIKVEPPTRGTIMAVR